MTDPSKQSRNNVWNGNWSKNDPLRWKSDYIKQQLGYDTVYGKDSKENACFLIDFNDYLCMSDQTATISINSIEKDKDTISQTEFINIKGQRRMNIKISSFGKQNY